MNLKSNNSYIWALALAGLLSLNSCGDDFLGIEPQGSLTPEVLENAQGVELLTTSAYALLTTRVDGRPMNVNSGEIENWGVEANVSCRVSRNWNVNANYSWVHMENPVISAPEHKLYAGADFRKGRWGMSTGIQYVKGLYTSVSPETTEDFVLWNLRADCRLCRWASLYVRGENLLAQRYEIMLGYPMPKATFLGGVSISL